MRFGPKDKLIVKLIHRNEGCATEDLIFKTLSLSYEQKYYLKKRLFFLEVEGFVVVKYIYNPFLKKYIKYYCFPD
jgi:hypothetical protein